MYESYWHLQQRPFENTFSPEFYYPGSSHQAALLKLRYAVENRSGAAVLAGPAGSGKTLVTTMLQNTLEERFSPFVHIVFPQMSPVELLAYLAWQFEGEDSGENHGVHESVRRIERFLTSNAEQGRHAVLVIDEAHLLAEPNCFETLRLLLNFAPGGDPAMTLLLVGRPALLPMLDRMPEWEERVAVKCLLKPFTPPETTAYVDHRLQAAGAGRAIISPTALPTLHELTQGLARRINRLCDLALLVGYAEERPIVEAEDFQAVHRELVAIAA